MASTARSARPSIPPERLLKAQLLIALYSVRSDRLFCETLDYNILFRWFLDMGLEEPSFDASTFSKNRERLAGEDVALKFFDAVVREARKLELLSDEHFSPSDPRTAGARGPMPVGIGTSRVRSGAMTLTPVPRIRKRSCCVKPWARKPSCALPAML